MRKLEQVIYISVLWLPFLGQRQARYHCPLAEFAHYAIPPPRRKIDFHFPMRSTEPMETVYRNQRKHPPSVTHSGHWITRNYRPRNRLIGHTMHPIAENSSLVARRALAPENLCATDPRRRSDSAQIGNEDRKESEPISCNSRDSLAAE